MMKKKYAPLNLIPLALLIAACSPKQPEPQNTLQELDTTLQSTSLSAPLKQWKKIYADTSILEEYADNPEVAAFLKAHKKILDELPEALFRKSITKLDREAYEWALELDPDLKPSYGQLAQIWKAHPHWTDDTLQRFPNALPVFMEQAALEKDSTFFNSHLEAFKASGFKLLPTQNKAIVHRKFIDLIALEINKAIDTKDNERIAFLIDHTPTFKGMELTRPTTRSKLQRLGDYMLYESNDLALTTDLANRGFIFTHIDIEKAKQKSPVFKAILANPPQAVRTLGLDKYTEPLSREQAGLLIKMPIKELSTLHPTYINEAIKLCISVNDAQTTQQFLELKNSLTPLTREDYLQLMAVALNADNLKIYALAKKKLSKFSIFDLNLADFAGSTRAFNQFAPKYLRKVYPTMDTDLVHDGITLGNIYRIFKNKNQQAGLYIVKKVDLEQDWFAATGQKRTLLMDACRAGNLDVVKFLIEKKKLNVHQTTAYSESQTTLFGAAASAEGKLSAIFFAAQSGNAELIHYLKKAGANINATTHYGATPLMYAVTANQIDTTQALIELGASVNAAMKEEHRANINEGNLSYTHLRNAYQRARATKNEALINLLKEAGAQP